LSETRKETGLRELSGGLKTGKKAPSEPGSAKPGKARESRGVMYDEKKILIMTKLALYDKRHGEQDRKCNEFFRHDYIYKKNMWTRLCSALGAVAILAIYWANKLLVVKVDILEVNFKQEALNAGIFIIAIMAVYTLIGTASAARQYAQVQERLKAYFNMLAALDRIKPERKRSPEEESNLYYEGDFARTRSNSTFV
jgi:hypothetical protein